MKKKNQKLTKKRCIYSPSTPNSMCSVCSLVELGVVSSMDCQKLIAQTVARNHTSWRM